MRIMTRHQLLSFIMIVYILMLPLSVLSQQQTTIENNCGHVTKKIYNSSDLDAMLSKSPGWLRGGILGAVLGGSLGYYIGGKTSPEPRESESTSSFYGFGSSLFPNETQTSACMAGCIVGFIIGAVIGKNTSIFSSPKLSPYNFIGKPSEYIESYINTYK